MLNLLRHRYVLYLTVLQFSFALTTLRIKCRCSGMKIGGEGRNYRNIDETSLRVDLSEPFNFQLFINIINRKWDFLFRLRSYEDDDRK